HEHAEPNWQPETVNEIRGVGTEQHELAMGEVEDAHHAGDDAESEHDEDDDGPEAQDFESGVQRAFHAASPANRPHWFAPRLPAWQSRRPPPFSTSGLRGYQASPRDFSGKVSLCVLETTLRGAARLRKHPSREPTSDPENNPCLRSPPRGQQG